MTFDLVNEALENVKEYEKQKCYEDIMRSDTIQKEIENKCLIAFNKGKEEERKEFAEIFKFPITLVQVLWTIQDSDGTQMDYSLRHKSFIDGEWGDKK